MLRRAIYESILKGQYPQTSKRGHKFLQWGGYAVNVTAKLKIILLAKGFMFLAVCSTVDRLTSRRDDPLNH